MTSTERLSALIGAIYDAALDSRLWPDVQSRLGEAVASSQSILFMNDLAANLAAVKLHPNWDPAAIADYERYYASTDPLTLDALQHPVGSVRSDVLLPDYDRYRRSAIYNELLVPNGAQHIMGSFIVRDSGQTLVLAYHRRGAEGPFEPDEQRLFGTVVPHLVRSVVLRRQFDGVGSIASGIGEALSRMRTAAFLVSGQCRVVEMNAEARRLTCQDDGLSIRGRHLACGSDAARRELRRLVSSCGSGRDLPEAAGGVMPVPRPSRLRPYHLMVSRLPMRAEWGFADAPVALVLVRDPEDQPSPMAGRLAAAYGLTASEARLAVALAKGLALKEVADEAGNAESTARGTLKQVLAKTRVRGQSELVRLILTGAFAVGGTRTQA